MEYTVFGNLVNLYAREYGKDEIDGKEYIVREQHFTRQLTPIMKEIYELALTLELPNPLGAAAYATSRRHNESSTYRPKSWHQKGIVTSETEQHRFSVENFPAYDPIVEYWQAVCKKLSSMKPETAARWEAHYLNGGSLKALRHSEDGWLVQRKLDDQRRASHRQAF